MNRRELANLIALGEGFTTEFKQSGTASLGRELCAFANADGGTVLIGVSDDGRWVGAQDQNRLKSEVQTIARSADPPIIVDIESVGEVLCISVPSQQSKPYSFGGKFYLRDGASSQQMSRSQIREFFFKEGLIHFDETPCTAFDLGSDPVPEVWSRFAARAGIPESMDMLAALHNLHLVKSGKMTHAGAWLLAEDITRYTLQAKAICALFQGTSKAVILDRKEFTGDLYTIYQDCMAYMRAKLNTAFVLTPTGREERLELPADALREALVNAIAHRDYRLTGNVQVHISRDRLEISSPGGLPAGMRKEDLGRRSVPRNPLLFGLLYRMSLVEQVGSGISRIRALCEDAGAPPPRIEVEENWVTISFQRPVEGAPRQDTTRIASTTQSATQSRDPMHRLLHLLSERGALSSGQLREALNVRHRNSFRQNYLRPALSAGLIERTIPEKPTSRMQKYRITQEGAKSLSATQSPTQSISQSATESPTQSTVQSDEPLHRLLRLLSERGALSSGQLREALGARHRQSFRRKYLYPALAAEWIEMTVPEKPMSRLQKYRITQEGLRILKAGGTE